jgi:hypothetical protein
MGNTVIIASYDKFDLASKDDNFLNQ